MSIFQAIFLGAIQGLGEFLPISSSAHLILAPWLFGWDDPGLTFDVALHFGTLVAVVVYLGKDWIAIVGAAFGLDRSIRHRLDAPFSRDFLWILAVATIPGAVAGYFLERYAETAFRNPLLIAGTLSALGLLLFWADRRLRSRKDIKRISWTDAIIIGLAQAFAIVPGISRSGSTITAALLLGIDRVSAARFSFLLSTPIIFGASALKARSFFANGVGWPEITGIVTAAVTGYCAMAFLVRFVATVNYRIFFWYRLALALLIVSVWLIR